MLYCHLVQSLENPMAAKLGFFARRIDPNTSAPLQLCEHTRIGPSHFQSICPPRQRAQLCG